MTHGVVDMLLQTVTVVAVCKSYEKNRPCPHIDAKEMSQ